MIIRVSYSDNDFAGHVQEACERILHAITDEFPAQESVEMFEEYLAKYGLENLRQRIVMAAMGSSIGFQGARGRFVKHNETLATFDKTMHYLDGNVKVELVDVVGTKWENSEVCFIDVWTKKVIVK